MTSNSWMDDVCEFHAAADLPICHVPIDIETCDNGHSPMRELRRGLLKEEYTEYMEAEFENDVVDIADALADMVYVICGTALSYGIPLDEVFAEVHRSNMTKVEADGKVRRRDDGKILKPESYEPPDIKSIIAAAAYCPEFDPL